MPIAASATLRLVARLHQREQSLQNTRVYYVENEDKLFSRYERRHMIALCDTSLL